MAVQLYHQFGARLLIDTLYSHGICASYDKGRHYITGIVQHEISKIQDDMHVPDGITPSSEGDCLIREGADNIDLNTETIDGKNTFHSMARVVFQTSNCSVESCLRQLRVQKCPDRSLDITESASRLSSSLPFQKLKEKCVPKRVPKAAVKILDCAGKVANES